ncbi:protein of unknown function (plasmid) [Cupriavidus taiwanensis]|nr:protein of unknown function [Cupriavidus taiwanensis]
MIQSQPGITLNYMCVSSTLARHLYYIPYC